MVGVGGMLASYGFDLARRGEARGRAGAGKGMKHGFTNLFSFCCWNNLVWKSKLYCIYHHSVNLYGSMYLHPFLSFFLSFFLPTPHETADFAHLLP